MESFAVFISSATVDHVIFYFLWQHSAKWLAIFYCTLGAERVWNKKNRSKILFMHKNAFMLPVSFTGPYTKDEPKFPQQKKNN